MSEAQKTEDQTHLDKAVAEGGAYEVLRKRLLDQGAQLQKQVDALNLKRVDEFKQTDMQVVGRIRIRSENNCVARDIVSVGDCLLFGYNVFLGLKQTTKIEDVFSLYKLVEAEGGFDVEPVAIENSFLANPSFVSDFSELYAYYKDTKLLQLMIRDSKLLASFQIGERVTDIRVFRWSLSADQKTVQYVDNRGERDIALPAPYDFEWQKTTREMAVNGRYPHLNILDTIFVETIGGDLTIKVENNTETGLGIYSEPVVDPNQSLDDAQIEYAKLGSLILLRILPYREENSRYFVYNCITDKVERIDAIGQSCVQLPENHGIIFPGGYYLQNGEHKTYEQDMHDMVFKRSARSPNGEDVLYIFYDPNEGRSALFTYNMIERRLQSPILGHGYARLEDGKMVIFANEGTEPIRVHPMQVWQTPYSTEEYMARQPTSHSFFGKIGNSELVRGVSDLYSLVRDINNQNVSLNHYNIIHDNIRKLLDSYGWLSDNNCGNIISIVRDVSVTSEAVLDEYEKVESIRRQSSQSLADAEAKQKKLLSSLLPDSWTSVQEYVDALNAITKQLGTLLTIRDYRYMDTEKVAKLETQLKEAQEKVSAATGAFLSSAEALQPFLDRLKGLDEQAQKAITVSQLEEPIEGLQQMANDLDVLSNLMSTLKIDDVTQRTQVVEAISNIYAKLNQSRAKVEQQRKGLRSSETVAQFAAQFTLFSQAITNALSLSTDPDRCDDQLSRLLIQLEELESQFSDSEEFLSDILSKREELLETFDAHKQSLLDDRQRKAQSLQDAALRILESIKRRTERLTVIEELNIFFASDPLIIKLHELSGKLLELKDSVRADDLDARLKGIKDQAIRSLRDKTDIFEEGGNVIKLGARHRFSVNTQELDLTILPRADKLYTHLTGTDFYEELISPELNELKGYWAYTAEAESPTLYRGEYLSGLILTAAEKNEEGLSLNLLEQQIKQPDVLARTVRDFSAARYRDGYERGIHDHDACLLLTQLIPLHQTVGLLRYPPVVRAFASLFWGRWKESLDATQWPERARSAKTIKMLLGSSDAFNDLRTEIVNAMNSFLELNRLPINKDSLTMSAEYLVEELGNKTIDFTFSRYARILVEALQKRLEEAQQWQEYQELLNQLMGRTEVRWQLVSNWLSALCNTQTDETAGLLSDRLAGLKYYIPEAVALTLLDESVQRHVTELDLRFTVNDLLGQHERIIDAKLALGIDDFYQRFNYHCEVFVPQYRRYQQVRQEVVISERKALRLDEFKPKPLSSFVRNKLINDVYLGVIGDNLAKQIGTVGENKRTDLMGLLMMISPPGYGKTTLMEYVANRLGLIFMRVNGPAIGHQVLSVDPAQAPNATAKQELEKLNLALEMGNNVMLYIDDIQHTNPEFLQKFISLCDATRRIEGVWKGNTKTYDMRGKKFCVVMAGNPYTESGEVFKIPDMLANRADIYNLGDVLGGMEETFRLSYIENSLTSNPVLAPLAIRGMDDLYRLIDKAEGKPFTANDLSHDYSAAEINEIEATLKLLMQARDLVYKVNLQYIASAAQSDKYRIEPAFKLQGSYRNMNKLAEKITAVMNQQELMQLLNDHYQGEAQLLTIGAEENLLKLAELRGNITDEQSARWEQIKEDFLRNKDLGGGDVGDRIVLKLMELVEGVKELANRPEPKGAPWDAIQQQLKGVVVGVNDIAKRPATDTKPWNLIQQQLGNIVKVLQHQPEPKIEIQNQSSDDVALTLNTLTELLESKFIPTIRSLDKKLIIDLRYQKYIRKFVNQLEEINESLLTIKGK